MIPVPMSLKLLVLMLICAAPAAAAPTCLGDTTGPFTPYACADADEPSAFASAGIAAISADGSGASLTVRTAAGTIDVTFERA